MSVNNEDKDIFITGCDSGGLFKCSLMSEETVQASNTPNTFMTVLYPGGIHN
jgi:hypothetical protein